MSWHLEAKVLVATPHNMELTKAEIDSLLGGFQKVVEEHGLRFVVGSMTDVHLLVRLNP